MSATGSLAAAIDRLYAAFADVPRPPAVSYCPCCLTTDDAQALLAPVALRLLPAEVVRPYAADVMLTVGGVDDFRYFLPRILEIACAAGFSWPDLEPLAGRMRMARWLDWPADEQHAVRGVLQALWAATLAVFPSTPDVDIVLCAVGNAEDDLRPYLADWAAALHQPPAAAHLLDLLHGGARREATGWRLTNAFWDGRHGQVATWLAGPDTRRAVTEAFTAAHTEQALQVLADIHDLLGPPDR